MSSPIDALIERLEASRKKLEHEFKVELPKAIGIAREHGDLKENAEYHAARERHAFVRAQLGHIAAQLEGLPWLERNAALPRASPQHRRQLVPKGKTPVPRPLGTAPARSFCGSSRWSSRPRSWADMRPRSLSGTQGRR